MSDEKKTDVATEAAPDPIDTLHASLVSAVQGNYGAHQKASFSKAFHDAVKTAIETYHAERTPTP